MNRKVFWEDSNYIPKPELKENVSCDYLIVGGGITGVSLAYFLNKLGAKKIVLIEKNMIGSGATGKSAGIITPKAELDLAELIEIMGVEKAKKYWKENHEVLKLIKKIIKKEKIKCDLEQQDTIMVSGSNKNNEWIIKEYEIEKNLEKKSEVLFGKKLRKEINSPSFLLGLISKDHSISVNPLGHVQALSSVAEKYGVKVYEKTKLVSIKGNAAKTLKGNIKFKKIILCIDSYARDNSIQNNKTTVVVTQKLTKKQLRQMSLIPKKIIWDAEDKYHYMKITKDNRLLMGFGDKFVGKKDKKIKPHEEHVSEINKFLKNVFPKINLEIEYAWSGTFGISKNWMPRIEKTRNQWKIFGSGSQLGCVIVSKRTAENLINKKLRI